MKKTRSRLRSGKDDRKQDGKAHRHHFLALPVRPPRAL